MQKIVYVNEVMGLSGIWYDLHNQDKELHDQFMLEVLELGHLKDETELFTEVPDMEFLLDSSGYIKHKEKYYSINKETDMRADENFHKVIEKYNKKLKKPYQVSYKEVPNHRMPSMLVISWDCGSESILFSD
jgi:hypothetical protein